VQVQNQGWKKNQIQNTKSKAKWLCDHRLLLKSEVSTITRLNPLTVFYEGTNKLSYAKVSAGRQIHESTNLCLLHEASYALLNDCLLLTATAYYYLLDTLRTTIVYCLVFPAFPGRL
jgi:hypothetical protein